MPIGDLIKNLAVHALKDAEQGILQVFAEIEGKLVPIAAEPLGRLDTHAEANPSGDGGQQ